MEEEHDASKKSLHSLHQDRLESLEHDMMSNHVDTTKELAAHHNAEQEAILLSHERKHRRMSNEFQDQTRILEMEHDHKIRNSLLQSKSQHEDVR